VGVASLLDVSGFHHFSQKSRIATQYCTFWKKDTGRGTFVWKAGHPPPNDHDDLFPKIAAAVRDHAYRRYDIYAQTRAIDVEIVNPVLVVTGPIFTCDQSAIGEPVLEETRWVLYRASIDSGQGVEDLFVDVITERYLDEHLTWCQKEYGALGAAVLKKVSALGQALDRQG
jgi:hypothetical protein